MMRKIIFTALLTTLSGVAAAQADTQAGARKWSLRECIDHAVENNITVRQQSLAVESAELELNSARNSRLPDVGASAGQNFSFGRSQNPATGVYEANRAAGTSVGVSAGATLFAGMRTANQIKAGELNLRAAAAGLERARQNLELSVASFYLDVLYRKELLKVADEQAALTAEQVAKTKALVDEEKAPRSQLYDIEAQLAQNGVAVTDTQNALAMALLNLSQALNLTAGERIADVEEPETTEPTARTFSPDEVYGIAVGVKPHVREAEYTLESSRRNVRIAQSARYPSISVSAGYNSGYSRILGEKRMDGDGVMEQIRNNQRQAVGLSLNIPIFNRFNTRNQIRNARLGVRRSELELDGVKQALYKEIEQACQSAVAAHARHRSTGEAADAARVAYDAAQLRYEVGRSTVYELGEAQARLFNARSEQLQARYEYLFRTAIIDFYRGSPIEIR